MSDPLTNHEDDIIRSWHTNAQPWTRALDAQSIASRKLVTDQAVIDAVGSVAPARVLDVGCGEGWLARALCSQGIAVQGIDVVPELIAAAQRQGGGNFALCAYADLAAEGARYGLFDAAVCNFSLLGQESVEALLGALRTQLRPGGHLIVQTLHPLAACGDLPYEDGWRAGTWAGFSADFRDPAPWYFRTLASWYAMLRRLRYELVEYHEPTARGATAPSSAIFICTQPDAVGL